MRITERTCPITQLPFPRPAAWGPAALILGALLSAPAAVAAEPANCAKIKAREDAQKAVKAAEDALKNLGTKPQSPGDLKPAEDALAAAERDRTQKETARNVAAQKLREFQNTNRAQLDTKDARLASLRTLADLDADIRQAETVLSSAGLTNRRAFIAFRQACEERSREIDQRIAELNREKTRQGVLSFEDEERIQNAIKELVKEKETKKAELRKKEEELYGGEEGLRLIANLPAWRAQRKQRADLENLGAEEARLKKALTDAAGAFRTADAKKEAAKTKVQNIKTRNQEIATWETKEKKLAQDKKAAEDKLKKASTEAAAVEAAMNSAVTAARSTLNTIGTEFATADAEHRRKKAALQRRAAEIKSEYTRLSALKEQGRLTAEMVTEFKRKKETVVKEWNKLRNEFLTMKNEKVAKLQAALPALKPFQCACFPDVAKVETDIATKIAAINETKASLDTDMGGDFAVPAPKPPASSPTVNLNGRWKCDCGSTWVFTHSGSQVTASIRNGSWSASLGGTFDAKRQVMVLGGTDSAGDQITIVLQYVANRGSLEGTYTNKRTGKSNGEVVTRQ